MTGSFLEEPLVSPQVQALYDEDLADSGYVWNLSRLWAHPQRADTDRTPPVFLGVCGMRNHSQAEARRSLRLLLVGGRSVLVAAIRHSN